MQLTSLVPLQIEAEGREQQELVSVFTAKPDDDELSFTEFSSVIGMHPLMSLFFGLCSDAADGAVISTHSFLETKFKALHISNQKR